MEIFKKDANNIVRARECLFMCLVPVQYTCFVYVYHISNANCTGFRDNVLWNITIVLSLGEYR